jgi:hypothetical protein
MPSAKDTGTDNPIYGVSIADASVTGFKLADGAISTTKVLDRSITTPKIADLSITTDKIADGAVTASELAEGAVTSASLGDGSVGIAKLASLSTSTSGPISGSTAGFVTGLNATVVPTVAGRPVLVTLSQGSSASYVFATGSGTTNAALLNVSWQIYRGTGGPGTGTVQASGIAQLSSLASGQAHTLLANPGMTFLDYLTPGVTYTYSVFIGSSSANVSAATFGIVQAVLSATAL